MSRLAMGFWGWVLGGAAKNPARHDQVAQRDDSLMSCAVHEAGHAVALRRGGVRVDRVAIGDWGGITEFRGKRDGATRFMDPRKIEACAVGIFAGQEAQVDWLVRRHGYTRGQALRDTAHGARSDMRQAPGYAAAAGVSVGEAHRQARSMVRRDRRRIERLAHQVRERGELGRWSL